MFFAQNIETAQKCSRIWSILIQTRKNKNSTRNMSIVKFVFLQNKVQNANCFFADMFFAKNVWLNFSKFWLQKETVDNFLNWFDLLRIRSDCSDDTQLAWNWASWVIFY